MHESGFPLEARVGIETVCRFKQSTNSLREKPEVKAGNKKPEVVVAGCWLPHFVGRRMPGNGSLPVRSALTQPHASQTQIATGNLRYSRQQNRLPALDSSRESLLKVPVNFGKDPMTIEPITGSTYKSSIGNVTRQ